jgi:DNA-binding NtrC family response regulator
VKPLKILIIEDEINLARTLAQALRLGSDGEYQVDTAPSAEKAYPLLNATEYDLVISDLKLPGDDGLTLITKVKEASPRTHTILMTGYGSKEVEGQADRLSEGYLTKPFDLLDLLHMVQKILSQPASQHSPALKRQRLAKDDHRRILIMEDDRSLRRIYTKALSKSRYQVDEAATIQSARRLLQENQYAIFVCDIHMGRDLGTELLDEFREKFQRQETHIVMCSEYGHYRYLSEEMGAEYFLEKPIALTTLLTLVNRLSDPV